MKRNNTKSIWTAVIVIILTLNITSTMKFSLGGGDLKASDPQIYDCNNAGTPDFSYSYIDCATCSIVSHYRPSSEIWICAASDPGESEN